MGTDLITFDEIHTMKINNTHIQDNHDNNPLISSDANTFETIDRIKTVFEYLISSEDSTKDIAAASDARYFIGRMAIEALEYIQDECSMANFAK